MQAEPRRTIAFCRSACDSYMAVPVSCNYGIADAVAGHRRDRLIPNSFGASRQLIGAWRATGFLAAVILAGNGRVYATYLSGERDENAAFTQQ